MGSSVEYISYNCVLFRYSQGRAESGGIALPVLSRRRQRELTFHHSTIGNFMVNMIELKQVYCSYSRTHNVQNVFLHSPLLFLRSTLLLKRNKQIGEEFRVFCKFAFPQTPLLTSALPRLLLLPVFYAIPPIN